MLNVKLLLSNKKKSIICLLNGAKFLASGFSIKNVAKNKTFKLRVIVPYITVFSRIGMVAPLKKFF